MATRIKPTANSPSKIQLARISHVQLRHPDPERFLEFAEAFGLVEEARLGDAIYLRGYGKDPYCYVVLPSTNREKAFEGGAFVVNSKDDLEKASKLPGATRKDISHLPGGGEMVSLSSPGGTKIHLVWGQKTRDIPDKEPSAQVMNLGPYNLPFTKERRGTVFPCLLHLRICADIWEANSNDSNRAQQWSIKSATTATSPALSTKTWPSISTTSISHPPISSTSPAYPTSTSSHFCTWILAPSTATTTHFSCSEQLQGSRPLCITVPSKSLISIHNCWVISGWLIKGIRLSGVWGGIFWGARSLTIGKIRVDLRSSIMLMEISSMIRRK